MLRIHSPRQDIQPGVAYRLDDGQLALRPGWFILDVRPIDLAAVKISEKPYDRVTFGHADAFRVERVSEVAR